MLHMFALLMRVRESRWQVRYASAVGVCAVALLVHLALRQSLAGAPFITFIPAVLIAALAGGTGPGIVAAGLGALMARFFFLPAGHLVVIWRPGWVLLVTFLFVTATMVALSNAVVVRGLELEKAAARLRQANGTLEKGIAVRTAELVGAEEQLRQAQKMEAVGQLTGGIAHDFNNLLADITGSLELLDIRLKQGRVEDAPRYLAMARESAGRAVTLTQRLLAFSRPQPLNPHALDMNGLIAGMAGLISRTIGSSIALKVEAAPQLGVVCVDANQLEQALLNLCINAADAMPEGGTVTIATANTKLPEWTELPAGDYVTLSVTDTGTGMTPEVRSRAFEPFFTTKPAGQGTGLGLAMTYGFARQSGGGARIASAPDQGTVVTLYLPRHAGPVEDEADTGLLTAH
jgi:signal transduction histidine kinase